MKRKIWTMGYFPFTIGGSVHSPMITEIIIKQLLDAAKVLKQGNSKWMENEEFFKIYKY